MKYLLIFLFATNYIFGREGFYPDTLRPTKPIGAFLRKPDLSSFFFNDHSGKISNKKPEKVHNHGVFLQALGNTPFVGIGYRYRLHEKPDYMIEAGLGVGWTPLLGWQNGKKISPFLSYSAHSNVVIKTGLIISPVLGFSGLLFGGLENNPRRFAFIPSPSFGIRLGSLNKVSLNFMWNTYFYKKQTYQYLDLEKRIVTKSLLLAYSPSANIQFSF